MTIQVVREPDNLGSSHLEPCCFCWKGTKFWTGTKGDDVACCPKCAAVHNTKELPSKEAWMAVADLPAPDRFYRETRAQEAKERRVVNVVRRRDRGDSAECPSRGISVAQFAIPRF